MPLVVRISDPSGHGRSAALGSCSTAWSAPYGEAPRSSRLTSSRRRLTWCPRLKASLLRSWRLTARSKGYANQRESEAAAGHISGLGSEGVYPRVTDPSMTTKAAAMTPATLPLKSRKFFPGSDIKCATARAALASSETILTESTRMASPVAGLPHVPNVTSCAFQAPMASTTPLMSTAKRAAKPRC